MYFETLGSHVGLPVLQEENGEGFSRCCFRGKGREMGDVPPADLQCMVVGCGRSVVTWMGREGGGGCGSSSCRQDRLPGSHPEPRESAGSKVAAAGLHSSLPSSPLSHAAGWGGFALFLAPRNEAT